MSGVCAFDLLSHVQDALAAPEVDVGWCQVVQALAVSSVIVVVDEVGDAALQLARQVIVFEQDAALQ